MKLAACDADPIPLRSLLLQRHEGHKTQGATVLQYWESRPLRAQSWSSTREISRERNREKAKNICEPVKSGLRAAAVREHNTSAENPVRARSVGSRFARDDKEPDPRWGKQLPGERSRETVETWHSSPSPSRHVRRIGAVPLSGAEEQTSRAISAHAQCAYLLLLQMGSIN
jgi:hypothetical protein